MKQAERQSAFDKVWQHFVADGQRFAAVAFGHGTGIGVCVYYDAETGARCPIGLLLPIEEAAMLDDAPVNMLAVDAVTFPSLHALLESVGVEFLAHLQHAHDTTVIESAGSHSAMAGKLRSIAAEYGLTVPGE